MINKFSINDSEKITKNHEILLETSEILTGTHRLASLMRSQREQQNLRIRERKKYKKRTIELEEIDIAEAGQLLPSSKLYSNSKNKTDLKF